MLKATNILRELLPKYFCQNHEEENNNELNEDKGLGENAEMKKVTDKRGSTLDVTKIKQLMRRAVQKLPGKIINLIFTILSLKFTTIR